MIHQCIYNCFYLNYTWFCRDKPGKITLKFGHFSINLAMDLAALREIEFVPKYNSSTSKCLPPLPPIWSSSSLPQLNWLRNSSGRVSEFHAPHLPPTSTILERWVRRLIWNVWFGLKIFWRKFWKIFWEFQFKMRSKSSFKNLIYLTK